VCGTLTALDSKITKWYHRKMNHTEEKRPKFLMFLYVTNVFKCFLIVGILSQLCIFDLFTFIISFDFSSSSHCSSKPRNETVRYADGLTWKVTICLASERLEFWQKVKCLLYYTYPIYVHIIFLYV
jgi:hypothetical protein